MTFYLIGGQIEPTWEHTSHGRKIESALKLKESGSGIVIVSEQQWVQPIDFGSQSRSKS